jgi:hypothetical protein
MFSLCLRVLVAKEKPKMWGSSIIGFSPRKANFSLHLVLDIKKYAVELKKLGKRKTEIGRLYINKPDDFNINVLEKVISTSAKIKLMFCFP